MKTSNKTLTTIGTAVAATFAASPASAENNPFAMSELDGGYMQLAQSDKAGEMKCGSKMDKKQEAACGEGRCGSMMEDGKMKKGLENSCGAMMKGKEGACGDLKAKDSAKKAKKKGYSVSTSGWGNKKSKKSAPNMQKEMNIDTGKGMNMDKGMEGMCGGMMEGGKMKKGMEGMCGEMMKGKEGACGMGMMGGGMKGMGNMQGMKGMGNMQGMQGMDNMQGMNGKKGGGMQGMGGMKGEEASCGAMISPEKAAGK